MHKKKMMNKVNLLITKVNSIWMNKFWQKAKDE